MSLVFYSDEVSSYFGEKYDYIISTRNFEITKTWSGQTEDVRDFGFSAGTVSTSEDGTYKGWISFGFDENFNVIEI